MRKRILIAAAISFLFGQTALHAQSSSIVVFIEPGFPIADSSAPPPAVKFPTAQPADADHLRDALAAPATHLLILPYASAFPEDQWPRHQAVLGPRRQSPRPRRKALHPRRLSRFFRLASSRLQRPLHPSAHDRPVPGNSRLRRPAIPAQSRTAIATRRVPMEARLQPRHPPQCCRPLPPRRRRRIHRCSPGHSRLGHQEWPQALSSRDSSRSLPQRFRRRPLDFRQCRSTQRFL